MTTDAPTLAPRVTYGRLSSSARATVQDYGLTVAAYVRHHDPDGTWHGDRCGCPDDRCRGYHHDPEEECGCLPVVLAELISPPPEHRTPTAT